MDWYYDAKHNLQVQQKSGRAASQAVALPDHVKRVDVLVQGNARLIVPAGGSWKDFFDGPRIDEDFLNDRDQPMPQQRNES